MLISLQVKNLALIEEEEIVFGNGLHILTGETGAGKSIILGALDLAMGKKVTKDMLRDSSKEGYVEAVFRVANEKQKEILQTLGIDIYEDEVILSRKITPVRSVAKINGETLPSNKLQEVASVFLDIYGQNEHQSLLHKKKHLQMLDEYGKDKIMPCKDDVKSAYEKYRQKEKELQAIEIDDEKKNREIEFLEHEIEEIMAAKIVVGEDKELEQQYKKLNHANKICEALNEVYANTAGAAAEQISRALRLIRSVEEYDDSLLGPSGMLLDTENLLSDFNRELSSYMDTMTFDPKVFVEIEQRLDILNSMKAKYGTTLQDVLDTLEEKQKRLSDLKNYDEYVKGLKDDVKVAKDELEKKSNILSSVRKKYAVMLAPLVKEALADLNFLDVMFDMYFTKTKEYSADGYDEAEFLISTNPGEPLKPLKDIASGGEMSRIMLALKTVLAQEESIDTLIFDEIDSGISGRTAQAVSERLSLVAKDHQVICITHLPQIAAMADMHYLIEKNVISTKTISSIRKLNKEESIHELARMLGGSIITEAVIQNASELKELAEKYKSEK